MNFNEYFQALYLYALAHGLNNAAAYDYATLGWLGAHFQIPALAITSGYRDSDRTAQLQAQWDTGNRTGLIVRPATNSLHHNREAFDLSNTQPNILLWYGAVSSYIPGMRWGGNFRNPDPVHFDLGGS